MLENKEKTEQSEYTRQFQERYYKFLAENPQWARHKMPPVKKFEEMSPNAYVRSSRFEWLTGFFRAHREYCERHPIAAMPGKKKDPAVEALLKLMGE